MSNESLSRLRVLILEDNGHMSSVLRAILQGFGVRELVEVRDAAAAFEACRDSQPDVAIVDYELGDITGLEFTQLIRTADDTPNPYLPVILVTAHSERWRVLEAINAGVNEFVVKPVSAVALYARLRAVIERPRAFVRARSYFGPDRRRRVDLSFRGKQRRDADTNTGGTEEV